MICARFTVLTNPCHVGRGRCQFYNTIVDVRDCKTSDDSKHGKCFKFETREKKSGK